MLRLLFFRPGGGKSDGAKLQKRSAPALRVLFGRAWSRRLPLEGDMLFGPRPAALSGTASFLLQDCADRVWAWASAGAPSACFCLLGKGSFLPRFRGNACCLFCVCVTSGSLCRKGGAGGTRAFACSGQPTERKNASSDAFGRGVLRLPGRWGRKKS